MTPEAYAEITALRNDVNSLINLGGRFIGVPPKPKLSLTATCTFKVLKPVILLCH